MPTDKKPTHRLRRNAVLALVAALAFTTVGLSAAGVANAGINGQQVAVNVPPGVWPIPEGSIPKNIHVYAEGTNDNGDYACTELEKLAETDSGTTYGKPAPWWWKDILDFTIVGTVYDYQGTYYEAAYRASAVIDKGSFFTLFTDVVTFEHVNTPWNRAALRPDLTFTPINWEQGTKVCDENSLWW